MLSMRAPSASSSLLRAWMTRSCPALAMPIGHHPANDGADGQDQVENAQEVLHRFLPTQVFHLLIRNRCRIPSRARRQATETQADHAAGLVVAGQDQAPRCGIKGAIAH